MFFKLFFIYFACGAKILPAAPKNFACGPLRPLLAIQLRILFRTLVIGDFSERECALGCSAFALF
jgi:hypothetical protein